MRHKNFLNCCKLHAGDVKIYRPIVEAERDYTTLCQDMVSLEGWSRLRQVEISTKKFSVNLGSLLLRGRMSFVYIWPRTSCKGLMKDLGAYVSTNIRWRSYCVAFSQKKKKKKRLKLGTVFSMLFHTVAQKSIGKLS